MRIKTRVKIGGALTICVLLAYGAVVLYLDHTMVHLVQESVKADVVVQKITLLRTFTQDYLLYRTERAQRQWSGVYAEVLQLLDRPDYRTLQSAYNLEDAPARLKIVGDTFARVLALPKNPEIGNPTGELQNRLSTELMLAAQNLVGRFTILNQNVNKKLLATQRLTSALNILALMLLGGLLLSNVVFLQRAVVKPVLKLQEGAGIIGSGNLDYKVAINTRDEVGELSRAFDGMTENIKSLTVSRDELELRVEERTAELERANQTLQQSEQRLRHLAAQVLTAQEKERKRMAMELHEGLGQSMTALKMYLRAIQRHLPPESAGIQKDFNTVQILLYEMIEEVRRMSRGLSPALLEHVGLTAALKHILDELGKSQEVTIKADIDDLRTLLSPQAELNLFRITQEALNNIAKHARATQVSVTIKKQDGRVNFCIKDDGVGFDLEQAAHENITDRGMGLAAMDERLRMIGAHLNIVSQMGLGTEISFSIPFNAN
ncbi:MAG: HAMP domain-containing sensor histidine kinase [Desulfobaccales bacterium]